MGGSTVLHFSATLSTTDPRVHPVLIVGQLRNLLKAPYKEISRKLEPRVTESDYNIALSSLHPSPTDSVPIYLNFAHIAALPSKCSRHNTPSRAHVLTRIVKSCPMGVDQSIVIVCESGDVFASACAVARAFPLYSRKTSNPSAKYTINVEYLLVPPDEVSQPLYLVESDLRCLTEVARGIQLAARIVDTPCCDMNVDGFLDEINKVAEALNIKPVIIRGEQLHHRGFGGLWSVGRAATSPPALAVLSHTPEGAQKTIAWVGKGIVYDTGGLCIKAKTSMVGMKRDCGGAAGILGAFYTAVKLGFRDNLHAVFCLAENAVGPSATRPDDITTLYSGKTVEINNTDAEGRLVLGDGVAYAQKDLHAQIILDMCTLTGSQGTATGKHHAGLITNSEEWEDACIVVGRRTGELVHPLPFCPELHFPEFTSAIADMKNSVADRSNAQTSCAALFVFAHIGFDFPGVWIHVDMASPVHCGERATGYGCALLPALFGNSSQNAMLQRLAPFAQENGIVDETPSKRSRLA